MPALVRQAMIADLPCGAEVLAELVEVAVELVELVPQAARIRQAAIIRSTSPARLSDLLLWLVME
jgi:hypothetical protein